MFVLLVLLICALQQQQQCSQLARSGEASPSEMVQLAAINMIIPLRNCCSKHNILRCCAASAAAELRLAVQKCTQISILGQENEIASASTTLASSLSYVYVRSDYFQYLRGVPNSGIAG